MPEGHGGGRWTTYNESIPQLQKTHKWQTAIE